MGLFSSSLALPFETSSSLLSPSCEFFSFGNNMFKLCGFHVYFFLL